MARLEAARQAYAEAWRAFIEHEPAYSFDDEADELVELMSAEMVFNRPENREEENHD